MYWQQSKLLSQFSTHEIELLGEKILMHFLSDAKCLNFKGFALKARLWGCLD